MPDASYAASIATQWKDFTAQHARGREQALSIALGDHPVPAGAVVGVYGSGKSTLLFMVLAHVGQQGVFPVWEEARAFLDRLVPPTERTSPQDFVARVHKWLSDLRTDPSTFAAYKGDLENRQLGDVAMAVEVALQKPTDRIVLLLDEMEQAYPQFVQRIETADHQPLRALIDSCGTSTVRLLMAYAPESFLTLGDADRGRMVRIAVPGLTATSIQQFFHLEKRHANFAWWASRGRARGVIKVLNEVIQPYLSGEFKGTWLGLPEALDGLPSVFGVPAVLRDGIAAGRIKDLLDLVPHRDAQAQRSYTISIRDQATLGQRMMEVLADRSPAKREDVEFIVNELLDILDAISDEEARCVLTFEDFAAGVRLATSRAIESGRLGEFPEGIDAAPAFFELAKQTDEGWLSTFSLSQLADNIFPSPFTEPVLPLADGRVPPPDDVDRLFAQRSSDAVVFHWKERACLIMRDSKTLGDWLIQQLMGSDENARWRILLLDDTGQEPGPMVLAREAGRIAVRSLGRFHACFIKCLSIRAGQEQLGNELEIVASKLRTHDRQLGRKVDWHLLRIGRLLDEMDPTPKQRWVAAVAAARGERLAGVLGGRLGEDSPGLLALLYPLKGCRNETRKILAELTEMLGEGSELRTLAKAVEGRRPLEGAAVVVDELLPARAGSAKRWVDGDFLGRNELGEVLERFAPSENAAILAKLLHPHSAARMEALVRFHSGKLPDLKPERQQLEALQGINAVMQRARSIHKGVQALLGIKSEVPGLVIGKLIGKALAAQKSFQTFNRLTERFERIEEPWGKALALWVGAVFAERIWAGVEKDEAQLRAWETISEEGRELGRTIEARLEELEDLGFAGVKEFMTAERGRIRAGLSDPELMQSKMLDLQGAIDQVADLVRDLGELRDLAADRNTEISQLLHTYRPEAGRISDDFEAVEKVLKMLGDIQDEWPSPVEEDLRSYLRRLEEFGKQSHAERLRSRLIEIMQIPLVSKEILLADEDVTQVEENWPKLEAGFSQACRDAIGTTPPSGSDKLVVWIKEAIEKQSLLSRIIENASLVTIDEKTRAWARRIAARPAHLSDIVNSRARTHQLLTNLSRWVSAPVIAELIKSALRAPTEAVQTTLEAEALGFQAELEKRTSRLAQAAGALKRPFQGNTKASVLNGLEKAASAAEERRDNLHQRVTALNFIVGSLGGHPTSIQSPLSVPEAERLVATVSDLASSLLNDAWQEIAGRLTKLGIDVALLERGEHPSEHEDLAKLQETRAWCDFIEQEVQALQEMGLPLSLNVVGSREETVERIRSAVSTGRGDLEELNRRIRAARLRLLRMGGPGTAAETNQFKTIKEGSETLAELKDETEKLRKQLLGKASARAREVYTAMVGGTTGRDPVIKPLVELRGLGLLRTIEDDV